MKYFVLFASNHYVSKLLILGYYYDIIIPNVLNFGYSKQCLQSWT